MVAVFFILSYIKIVGGSTKLIFLFLISAFFVINGTLLFLARKQRKITIYSVYLEALIEITAITVVIMMAGENHDAFLSLFIIPILTTSLFSVPFTIFTAVAIISSYIGLHMFLLDQNFWGYTGEVNHILILLLLMAIAIFQSRYYFYKLKKSDEEIMSIKDEFLFQTIHDLRSPVTNISWIVDKIKNTAAENNYSDIEENTKEIKGFLERVKKLSENVLALAEGEKVEIKKEPVNIATFISDALKEIRPSILDKNIEVEYEAKPNLPAVFADTDLLKELVLNILGNAVKYNRPEGKIKINIFLEKDLIKIEVFNTGPMISKEDIKKLFTPYFRGEARKTIEGTGLGLYITRKIAERMGGEVGIKSSDTSGTTFFVSLPVTK